MSKTIINQENQGRSGLEEALGGWECSLVHLTHEVFQATIELSVTKLACITLSGVNISAFFTSIDWIQAFSLPCWFALENPFVKLPA